MQLSPLRAHAGPDSGTMDCNHWEHNDCSCHCIAKQLRVRGRGVRPYHKEGVTRAQIASDRFDCIHELTPEWSRQPINPDRFHDCMQTGGVYMVDGGVSGGSS